MGRQARSKLQRKVEQTSTPKLLVMAENGWKLLGQALGLLEAAAMTEGAFHPDDQDQLRAALGPMRLQHEEAVAFLRTVRTTMEGVGLTGSDDQ